MTVLTDEEELTLKEYLSSEILRIYRKAIQCQIEAYQRLIITAKREEVEFDRGTLKGLIIAQNLAHIASAKSVDLNEKRKAEAIKPYKPMVAASEREVTNS